MGQTNLGQNKKSLTTSSKQPKALFNLAFLVFEISLGRFAQARKVAVLPSTRVQQRKAPSVERCMKEMEVGKSTNLEPSRQ